jgi:photosystem II stability/assembly factor-like uncharacterized protein
MTAALLSAQAAPPPVTAADLSALRFRNIGPATMSGRFVDLAVVERDPYTFYAASATGGIFRTTDNGVTFAPVFEKEAVHSIGAIAVNQANPNILWVGTGERANRQSSSWGDGVYKSIDAGKTWTNVGLRDSHHIGRIVLHPTNPDVAFVAAMGHLWGPNDERGLYRTSDGGRSWTQVLRINYDTGVVDVAMDPSDPTILYAAAYQRRRTAFGFDGGGPGSGLYKSVDGGTTWRKLTGRGLPAGEYGRIGISIYRKDPNVVYVSIEQGGKYNASTAYIIRKGGVYRSEDKGENWTFKSDWNPRPMYASQIVVDPNDDKRIYMVNSYSYSDDGGATFRPIRQSLHGDDRLVWVDARDSRHIIKLDDGGIGISYDRGLKWLYIPSLPVSQWYRIAVDNAVPYNVYGGLQDNGCWMGPSATYQSTGILNEDWKRLCGGDGFFVQPDPANPNRAYSASQFLGLTRNDLQTWQSSDVRPGDPTGAIGGRRNFDIYEKKLPAPDLGNAMHPANWDAPFQLSPHDSKTIYAGGQHLFRSRDQGTTWEDLGDMTTGVDRRSLPIMERLPTDDTLSLDDGVPYWPTISALAESPRVKGLVYTGADDGRLRVSRDEGKTWTNLETRVPGLPKGAWFSGLEPSRHADGTVYMTVDNHRSDDFANYVYRSTDFGQTWTSIASDLPAKRVARTIREDAKNPNLLYLGTEFGLFVSIDAGAHWVAFGANLPTLPINDLVVHPRDQDLVLATHGRGVWILDGVSALQELTPAIAGSAAALFTPKPADMIRYTNLKAHMGDMVFRGENPPAGGAIDYWIGGAPTEVALTIHDAAGAEVNRITATKGRGVNRVIWNLRYADLATAAPALAAGEEGAPGGGRVPGRWVAPGVYTVRLRVDGQNYEKKMTVRDDPRIDVSAADARAWRDAQTAAGDLYKRAVAIDARLAAAGAGATLAEPRRLARELVGRLSSLYNDLDRWTGRPTADQLSRLAHYRSLVERLER